MKLKLSLLSLILTVSIQAAPFPRSFSLAIEGDCETETSRTVKLKVESQTGQMIQLVQVGGWSKRASFSTASDGEHRHCTVIVSAREQERGSHVVASLETSFNLSNTSEYTISLPARTKIDSLLSLTVTNGTYELENPLKIGTLLGKPLMLTVGRRQHSSERENRAEPAGAANRSQPVDPETNRTSSTAGSDR